MAGYPVTGDEYRSADKLMMEIKHQMNQSGGCPIPPKLILDAFQRLIDAGGSHLSTALQSVIDPDVALKELRDKKYLNSNCVSALERFGIRNLRDLTHYTLAQIEEMPNIGAHGIAAIRLLLGDAGLQFRSVPEDDDWRRLNGGPIRRRQLLTLSPIDDLRSYGAFRLRTIAQLGIVTFADFAFVGHEGVRKSLGVEWHDNLYKGVLDQIYMTLETPAY